MCARFLFGLISRSKNLGRGEPSPNPSPPGLSLYIGRPCHCSPALLRIGASCTAAESASHRVSVSSFNIADCPAEIEVFVASMVAWSQLFSVSCNGRPVVPAINDFRFARNNWKNWQHIRSNKVQKYWYFQRCEIWLWENWFLKWFLAS